MSDLAKKTGRYQLSCENLDSLTDILKKGHPYAKKN